MAHRHQPSPDCDPVVQAGGSAFFRPLLTALLRALATAGFLAGMARAQAPAAVLSPEDAHSLATLIRQGIAGRAAPRDVPAALQAKTNVRLVVTVFRRANRAAMAAACQDTLAASAAEVAKTLAKAMGGEAEAQKALMGSVLVFEVVTKTRPVTLDPKEPIGSRLDIGTEGLAISVKGDTRFFSPLVVLYHATAPSFLESLYGEMGETPPAPAEPGVRAEAFTTKAFVERYASKEATELSSGNVPAGPVNLKAATRAYLAGAAWILGMQDEEGKFVERLDPLAKRRLPGTDLVVQLQAAQSLLWVYVAVGDPDLKDAADKTIALAKKNILDTAGVQTFSFVKYGMQDEFTPSVALLQTLCARASAVGKVEDLGLMERLGRFILDMTREDGSVYLWLKARAANEPPSAEASAGPAVEAALALCALSEHTPPPANGVWLQGADRILKPQLASAMAGKGVPSPRLVEAAAHFYLLKGDKQYAEQCIQLASQYKDKLYSPGENVPAEFVGGYRRDGGPLTSQTAMCLKALVLAHDIAGVSGRAEPIDPAPILAAVRFVMSQQFREENTFYLQRPEMLQGAFRAGARDLFAQLDTTRTAVDGLISALDVVAKYAGR